MTAPAWRATYVINLDRDVERLARMDAQCARLGIPYRRVRAVDGGDVDGTEEITPLCAAVCTPGMIGCALSHIGVWKRVVAAGHACALVMEDDARLVPTFVKGANRAMRDVPDDWDVLLLGCFLLCNKSRRYPWPHRLMRWFAPGRRDLRTWGSVYVPEFFGGTHCYLVSQRGARKLLALVPRAAYHIDMCMNHPEVRLYATSPDLAFQRDMDDSGLASYSFPKTLEPLLSAVRDDKGISAAYYLAAPGGRVGGVTLNAWTMAFLVLGLLRARSAPYVAGFLVAELAVGGRVGGPLLAYALGWAVAAAAARQAWAR